MITLKLRLIFKTLYFTFILFCFPLLSADYCPARQIFNHKEEMGKAAARLMADLILDNHSQNRSTVLGLATGSTPLPVYQAFKDIVKEEGIDLSQVITFNLDEYCGLPSSHPESYRSFMFSQLFSDLIYSADNPKGFRLENIHIPNGYAKREEDLSSEELDLLRQSFQRDLSTPILTEEEEFWILQRRAEEYERLIKEKGPIQLQLLGIGTNGHIGFAEPGSSLDSGTAVVELTENTRLDNAAFFKNDVRQVPKHAITMGVKTILQAEKIILLATGKKKAVMIEKSLHDPISEEVPATALRMHPQVCFFLDPEAFSAVGQQRVFRYYNARIVKNHELIIGELWTAGGKVIPPQEKADYEIDVHGLIIAPGYIDLQINGGFGIDFSAQADRVKEVAKHLPQYGVTAFLPTLVSLKREQYPHLLPHLLPFSGGGHGSTILGIHLEGPFFAANKH